MIRKITKRDYPTLIKIWESAVLNTHDFLKEEDFNYYKELIPTYFEHVKLFGYEVDGILVGFIGTSNENIEMLFIDDNFRGKGIGKKLIKYGIEHLNVSKVDVNEQNLQAVGFYKHMGFQILKGQKLMEKARNIRFYIWVLIIKYLKNKKIFCAIKLSTI